MDPDSVIIQTVTIVSSSQIDLGWTESTDATQYTVYRDGSPIGSTTSTFYQDTGLEADTLYSYTVKAVDAAGNVSPSSNTVWGTTEQAQEPPEFEAKIVIDVVELSRVGRNTIYQATATITITDSNGPIQGATVSGNWEGATNDYDTGITDVEGIVKLTSNSVKLKTEPTFNFVISEIILN